MRELEHLASDNGNVFNVSKSRHEEKSKSKSHIHLEAAVTIGEL